MIVVIRKAARGSGFDVHAPEGFEEHDRFNEADYAGAMKVAAEIAEKYEAVTGTPAELSDETHLTQLPV
jgi:hypothetical protein